MNKISNISHVYFTGGGLKGICYLGIIRYLYMEDMVDKIKYIVGTSIGAYFGLILALRIPIEYIEEELSLVVKHMRQHMCISKDNLANLFENNGVLNLDFLMYPIEKYFRQTYDVDDMTFIDFVKKTGVNLYVNSMCLNTSDLHIFSIEKTPNVSVLSAVRASMSIPYLFQPVSINGEHYIDSIYSVFDIFDNIDKNSVLIVILPKDNTKYDIIYPQNKEFNFFEYLLRVSEILVKSLYKDINDSDEIFKIDDLPYDTYMKFEFTDQEIYVDITKEDMDDMIIKGFVDFSLYMNKRYKVYMPNI